MPRFLKIGLVTILGMLLAIIIGVLSVVIFVNPNSFKTPIYNLIEQNTGYKLNIAGDIHWTFFPWLGIRIEQAALANNTPFAGNLAELGEALVKIKLLPLLHREIIVGDLTLKNLTINLIEDKIGQTNWQGFLRSPKQQPKPALSDKKSPMAAMAWFISAVNVSNANIDFYDQKTNNKITISDFNFTSSNISLNKPFSVDMAFGINSTSPSINSQVKLQGKLFLDLVQQHYAINDFIANINIIDRILVSLGMKADMSWDRLNNLLTLDKMIINAPDVELRGHLLWRNFVLASIKDMMKIGAITGSFSLPYIKVADIAANDVQFDINSRQGQIDLAPISAKIFQGTSQGAIKINWQATQPRITIQDHLANIQVAEALAKAKGLVTGIGDVDVDITAQGQDIINLLRTLNGTASFKVKNGNIRALNIAQQLTQVSNEAFKKNASGIDNSDITVFSRLSGTFNIQNGIANNNDLLLESPSLRLSGKGSVDLNNENYNYYLYVTALSGPFGRDVLDVQQQLGGSVPLKVAGNFAGKPKVAPDWSTIAKQLAKGQVKRQIKEHLGDFGDMLQKVVPIDQLLDR